METISFSKDYLINKNTELKKLGPRPSVLKHAVHDELPKYEEKNVLIYTIDKDELWHGNGYGFPLSKVTYGITATKDVVFVCSNIKKGVSGLEIPFPYFGTIKEILISISSSNPPLSQFIINLECLHNRSWITVKRLFIEANQTSLIETTDFKINNETLRLNVIDAQDEGLDNVVIIVKIDI